MSASSSPSAVSTVLSIVYVPAYMSIILSHELKHITLQSRLTDACIASLSVQAEQVIEEDNMLEAFNIIGLYCDRLIEHAKQLDKPDECGEDIREAAAGIMFAAGWCGDLPELLFARTILADKFGGDFAMMAKEGTGVVDPMECYDLFTRMVCGVLAVGLEVGWQQKKHGTEEKGGERNCV
ncbi:uncharacterized protein LOC112877310 isoform X1 [Panicum hallii]|uniref:uncharacterized protein LOC112877310 isoform X1 n=1 Tax=Panicum hallii TaxID=206008 RepID=UPI000DF4ECEB|nr:uncharacterized protein LOC112877310 isoform X1 [Panicum hallii]